MTRACYERLKHRFECKPAGVVTLKGIGSTEFYYLLAERALARSGP